MSHKLGNVPVTMCDYPSQPRSHKLEGYIESLAANIKANGQQVPVIGWTANGRFKLIDGGCRLEAIRHAGLTHVLALMLEKEPTKGELLIAQASIDLQKQHLPPVDRARLFESIIGEKNLTGKDVAELLGISPSLLSRYLLLTKLAPDIQEAVNSGGMDWSKASLIAQATPDHEQQRVMAKAAATMSRDQLAATVRRQKNGHANGAGVKVNRLTVPMGPRGSSVTIAGSNMTFDQVVELLQDALKYAKKALADGLDGKTWARVMADKAKAGGV